MRRPRAAMIAMYASIVGITSATGAYVAWGVVNGPIGGLWRHDPWAVVGIAMDLWWLWAILAPPAAACVWFLAWAFKRRRIW